MRGYMKERTPGSWTIWLDHGRDANGKRMRETITVKGNKREAQRRLTERLHQLNNGSTVSPAKMSLANLLRRWLKDYGVNAVRAKTSESMGDGAGRQGKPIYVREHQVIPGQWLP